MMKDKALEDFFHKNPIVFDDNDEFMARLEIKLNSVDKLRQYETANIRHYRYAMLIALFIGIVVGGALLALVLSIPTDQPMFSFHVSSGLLLDLEQYSRTISITVLSLLIGLGGMTVIGNIFEILQMRFSMIIRTSDNCVSV
ncbi:MAG: hypothetical protein KBT34_05160 [Prevotella sp.]|nr:hypothetical protein [Candidatus Prevotella equi]